MEEETGHAASYEPRGSARLLSLVARTQRALAVDGHFLVCADGRMLERASQILRGVKPSQVIEQLEELFWGSALLGDARLLQLPKRLERRHLRLVSVEGDQVALELVPDRMPEGLADDPAQLGLQVRLGICACQLDDPLTVAQLLERAADAGNRMLARWRELHLQLLKQDYAAYIDEHISPN